MPNDGFRADLDDLTCLARGSMRALADRDTEVMIGTRIVATTTLFKHFPGKEALVFDQDSDREAELVAVVRGRPAGQSVVDALRRHVLDLEAGSVR